MPGQIVYFAAVFGAIAAPALFMGLWLFARRARRVLWAFGALLAIPYALAVWAFILEPKTLAVRHVTIESARWSGPPLRIGVLTDIHVTGPHMPPARVADIVARMNAQRPDMVALLGDYIDGHEPRARRSAADRAALSEGIAALSGLRAPFGVYAVIGNHDVWYDAGEVAADLRGAKALVLEDQSAPLPVGGSFVVGLNEYSMIRTDFARATEDVTPGAPLIVLTHYPDAMRVIDRRAALTLAGHSHCGQLGIPGLNKLIVASRGSRRWLCGAYEVDGKPLYVAGGVGTSILPMRFLRPPEIVIVTLKAER